MTITNNWGLYQTGSGTKNYFEGNVGIGDSTPTEGKLVVRGDANTNGLFIGGNSTTGQSYGALINAGTDSSDANFRLYDQTGSTPYMFVRGDGNVGIGTASPEYALQVSGSNVLSGGGLATVGIYDNGTAYNGTNPGGGITFRGKYNSSAAITNFATVQGIKENATDGDYDTALRFTTRSNAGNLTEKVRISSGGNVGIVTITNNV